MNRNVKVICERLKLWHKWTVTQELLVGMEYRDSIDTNFKIFN